MKIQAITKSNTTSLARKLLWFAAYWLAGVLMVGAVAEVIRLIILPAKH
ncbi:MAG: DUF2474 domain-containing protein [Aestuariivirga sp.]